MHVMRINQNVMAVNANRNLAATSVTLGKSLEKLSSGFRINRASDDAAGLVISQKLRAQLSGLNQAIRNAQDGVSVVQTAEGALTEVHSMLTRMRELAVQAANSGANDPAARQAAQDEVSQLSTEITRIAGTTKFGSVNLLDGSYGVSAAKATMFDANNSISFTAGDDFNLDINGAGAVVVELSAMTAVTGAAAAAHIESAIKTALTASNATNQGYADNVKVSAQTVGAGSAITIEVDGLTAGQTFTVTDGNGTPLVDVFGAAPTVSAAAGSGGQFQVGALASETITVAIGDMDATALGVNALDLATSGATATAAITTIDSAISTVSTERAELGSVQNRFESIVSNLSVTVENLTASESRIRDTDMAKEMAAFTRNQILSQAGTAMLAQANAIPQAVLRLLQ